MPIMRISSSNYNSPISRFTYENALDDYDLNPSYQRGHVWGVERKRNLIKSMLMGLPIGAIIVNNRFKAGNYKIPDNGCGYAVVDGKQRITAMVDFTTDKFSVPREWFEDDEVADHARNSTEIIYSDLSDVGRREFTNIAVPVVEASVEGVEKEAELFSLVNYGGVNQGESDHEDN